MDTTTKCCELTIVLTSGVRLVGLYHVPVTTGSAVRPSDAIRNSDAGYLLLSDVTITDAAGQHKAPTMLVRSEAIAYIELPPKGWMARPGTPAIGAVSMTTP